MANEVLVPQGLPSVVAIRDVPTPHLQPPRPGHHPKIPLQAEVHLRAVDDAAGGRVVAHLRKGHRRAQHVPGELFSALGIL